MEVEMVSMPRSFVGKGLISLLTSISISMTPVALAQDQANTPNAPGAGTYSNETQFIIDNDLAISKMSLSLTVDPTGDVDRDFVAIMMPHHQGAIDIARGEVKYGHNEELRRLAQNIIAERQHEMSIMHGAVGQQPRPQTGDTPVPESAMGLNSGHSSCGRTRE
jgi:hypothetical protein